MISGLGHIGLYVHDLERSKKFYTEMLDLEISDESPEMGTVFLSAQPLVEHHELLLCAGRDVDDDERLVQQISFRCDTLEDVIAYYHRFRDAGVAIDRVISHGNAIGVYFFDPDHNRCEVYWRTGLSAAHQPYIEEVDIEDTPESIMASVETSVRLHGADGLVPGRSSRT